LSEERAFVWSIDRTLLLEGSETSPVCPYESNRKMSVEQSWDDTDRGKLKCWEKNIIQRGW